MSHERKINTDQTLEEFFKLSREERFKQWENDQIAFGQMVQQLTHKYKYYIAGFHVQAFRGGYLHVFPEPDGNLFEDSEIKNPFQLKL